MAYRRLWPDDRARLLAHYGRLDTGSRRMRFARPVTDAFLARYCADMDWWRAILLGYFVESELRGVGELRRLPGAAWRTAEFAVTVEMPWRRRGVGMGLLQRLVALGRNRGIESICMICLADNLPVQRMARRLNARLSQHWGEAEGRIEIGRPTLVSHLHEALAAVLPAECGSAGTPPHAGGPTEALPAAARAS